MRAEPPRPRGRYPRRRPRPPGQQLSGGRVVRLKRLAGRGGDPLAVDQHLLIGAIGKRMTGRGNGFDQTHDQLSLQNC